MNKRIVCICMSVLLCLTVICMDTGTDVHAGYYEDNDKYIKQRPVPASILASIWLAGILHPDQVSTDTYTKEMNSFYETFYGIKK